MRPNASSHLARDAMNFVLLLPPSSLALQLDLLNNLFTDMTACVDANNTVNTHIDCEVQKRPTDHHRRDREG